MIIVSQDKTAIINFNNILKIECINNEIIVFYKNEETAGVTGTESVGIYKTEERAKEVLQELARKYESCNYESCSNKFGYVKNKTYKMPKE